MTARTIKTPLFAALALAALALPASAMEFSHRACARDAATLKDTPIAWHYVLGTFAASEEAKMNALLEKFRSFNPQVLLRDASKNSKRRVLVGESDNREGLRTLHTELRSAGAGNLIWLLACAKSDVAPAGTQKAAPPPAEKQATAPAQAAPKAAEAAVPPSGETLKDVVRETLATNPEVATAAANKRASEGELDQAKAGNLPVVDLRAAGGREESDNATTGAAGGPRILTRKETGVTVRQMLYDGGQVQKEIERQTARATSSNSRLSESRESVAQRTADVYLEVLRNQELHQLAQDNLAIHQDMLQKTETRVKGGAGMKADLQLTEGRTALASATLVQRFAGLQDAQVRYQRQVGKMPGDLVRPASPKTAIPPNQELAVEIALATHPAIFTAKAELEAALAASQNARAKLAPLANLELGATRNRNLDGSPGANNDVTAMVTVSYNLFRGGADDARIRETAERQTAAQETLQNARRAIEEDVSRAWIAMTSARESLKYMQQHVQSTREVLESYRAQYDLGKRTMLDLMNSEGELFQARSNLTTGEFSLLQAQYRLLATMGGLVKILGL